MRAVGVELAPALPGASRGAVLGLLGPIQLSCLLPVAGKEGAGGAVPVVK